MTKDWPDALEFSPGRVFGPGAVGHDVLDLKRALHSSPSRGTAFRELHVESIITAM
jgi:hypothetical protein